MRRLSEHLPVKEGAPIGNTGESVRKQRNIGANDDRKRAGVRQKKEKNFMRDMKKGDRIITKSGIHGKIMELNDKDNTCIVETLAGKLKIERSAISLEMSSKLNAPDPPKK